MKIARFEYQGQLTFGILDEEQKVFVKLAGDPLYLGYETLDEHIPLDQVTLQSPVLPRSKVIGFGRNYAEHAKELGNEVADVPLMFLKPNTSVIGPNHPIVLPPQSQQVEHEAELAVVIGQVARNVPAEHASQVIFGYTIANDVTARDLQKTDGQWARAKGFDSFCPVGPIIETDFDPSTGAITCDVNGERRQTGDLSQMVTSVADLVAYASSVFTLLPGDLILTGTPAGVGTIAKGDVVTCSIEGIGSLSNPVTAR